MFQTKAVEKNETFYAVLFSANHAVFEKLNKRDVMSRVR
jgi:hypothetical protein